MSLTWQEWTPKVARFYAEVLRSSSANASRHLHSLNAVLRYGLVADLSAFELSTQDILRKDSFTLRLKRDSALGPLAEPEWDEEPGEESNRDSTESDDSGSQDSATAFERARSAALRILRRQEGDPHNRETTIGYPIIGGRAGRQLINGALLNWDVELEYNPGTQRLVISKRSQAPTLNVTLLERFVSEPRELDALRTAILPLLISEEFGADTVAEILKIVVGGVEALRYLHPLDSAGSELLTQFVTALRESRAGEAPLLLESGVLLNGPRSFAHLLDDLDAIGKLQDIGGKSALANIVGDVPDEGVGEVEISSLPFQETADGGDPLWFPRRSNKAQRRIARLAAKADVLTVQGPPGTGKSHTIANLVSHFVSTGKTVLVTSHQQKALEVVTDLLPKVDYLAMSVLRGDKESMARLKAQLTGTQSIDETAIQAVRSDLKAATERLHSLDQELRRLTRRYMELKQVENDEHHNVAQYGELKEYDQIDHEDSPPYNRVHEIARALREWADLVNQLGPALHDYSELVRPDGEGTTRIEEVRIVGNLQDLSRLVEWAERPVTEAAAALMSELDGRGPALEDEINALATWFADIGEVLAERFLRIEGREPDDAGVRSWHSAARRVGGDEIVRLRKRVMEEVRFFESSALTARDVPSALGQVDRLRLIQALTILEGAGRNIFRWHLFPSVRNARKGLVAAGFPKPLRRTIVRDLEHARAVIEWDDRRSAAGDLVEEILDVASGSGLNLKSRAGDGQSGIVRVLGSVSDILEIMIQLLSAPLLHGDATGIAPKVSFSLRPGDRQRTIAMLTEVVARLRYEAELDRIAKVLDHPGEWYERIRALITELRSGSLTGEGARTIDHLNALVDNYPHYQRLVDLETTELSSLHRTRTKVREQILKSRSMPEWVADAEKAFDAHRLGSLLRQSLAANPDDLTEIAKKIRDGQDKRLRLIGAVIERKRKVAVATAVRRPANRVALRELSKLLNRRSRTDSLLALRGQIDYGAVLEVFPAWVCTIEDVARLFPLEAGLFDVLIVDEASQCAQTTALPLAFRAKRMIVVGDEEQLKPATARFLAQGVISTLQSSNGLDQHPKAMFINGRDSFLELAEACSNASDFLDEHFRCDPAIIRWSNHRFYNNRLKIMTSRRANSFPVALRVYELKDADDDPDKKVNLREAEAVVAEARRLVESGEADRLTIGIISPYRDQADLIQQLLLREFSDIPDALIGHRITASTADGFQGDERDIILYSFRYGPSSSPGVVTAIQNERERLNVAFTRAKRLGICFISVPIERFPKGEIRDFLMHSRTVQNRAGDLSEQVDRPDHFDSEFERKVCQALRDRGLKVTTQEPCAGFRIDLVVEDEEGRILGVECDGAWKEDEFGRLRPEDYHRQDILERANWVIHRISGRRYYHNPEFEIDRVVETLRRQPTAKDRAIHIGPRLSERQLDVSIGDRAPERPNAEAAQAASSQVEPLATQVEHPSGATEAEAHVPTLFDDVVDTDEERAASLAHPEDLTTLDARLDFLGATAAAQVVAVKKLLRWGLEGALEGSAIDDLNRTLDAVNSGRALTNSQVNYLHELWESAKRQGFDPDEVILPDGS